MTFIEDWKAVLKHAWSVRLMLLSAVLSAASAALMFAGLLPIDPVVLVVVTFLVNVAAVVARFVAQKQFKVTL